MNYNLLSFLLLCNVVSGENNCTINKNPITYSKWLGGRNNSHSTINTLINQLDDYNNNFASKHRNLIKVFQAQLTETADDILGCATGTLHTCPQNLECTLHILGIFKRPALEYWQNRCQHNNVIITNWLKYNHK